MHKQAEEIVRRLDFWHKQLETNKLKKIFPPFVLLLFCFGLFLFKLREAKEPQKRRQ